MVRNSLLIVGGDLGRHDARHHMVLWQHHSHIQAGVHAEAGGGLNADVAAAHNDNLQSVHEYSAGKG